MNELALSLLMMAGVEAVKNLILETIQEGIMSDADMKAIWEPKFRQLRDLIAEKRMDEAHAYLKAMHIEVQFPLVYNDVVQIARLGVAKGRVTQDEANEFLVKAKALYDEGVVSQSYSGAMDALVALSTPLQQKIAGCSLDCDHCSPEERARVHAAKKMEQAEPQSIQLNFVPGNSERH